MITAEFDPHDKCIIVIHGRRFNFGGNSDYMAAAVALEAVRFAIRAGQGLTNAELLASVTKTDVISATKFRYVHKVHHSCAHTWFMGVDMSGRAILEVAAAEGSSMSILGSSKEFASDQEACMAIFGK